ncbi:hypothetical protein ACFX1X_032576 [Malus domestica]
METPHLSGIAALIKKSHPDWFPAAIKYAIMTTANVLNLASTPIVNQDLTPADVFAIGGGHVNPAKANDPGLIFDIKPEDYFPCPNHTQSQYYTRTVKNVRPAMSAYNLDLLVPHQMGMSVNPQVLTFTEVNEEITYHVEFIAQDGAGKNGVPYGQGYLRCFSDKHNVTTPIAVIFDTPQD